jgi:hypothetical protein
MSRAVVVVKYAALVAAAFVYWIALGHGHSWVPAALMLAAIKRDYVKTLPTQRVA